MIDETIKTDAATANAPADFATTAAAAASAPVNAPAPAATPIASAPEPTPAAPAPAPAPEPAPVVAPAPAPSDVPLATQVINLIAEETSVEGKLAVLAGTVGALVQRVSALESAPASSSSFETEIAALKRRIWGE